MAVTDKKMLNTGKATWKCLTMLIGTTSTGQTGVEVDELRPGFNFEITKVEVYATAVTAVASVNVLIGSTTALASAMTPTAGNVVQGTLATSKAARRGSATENIVVQYTTDGAGAITNGRVRVWVRPFPLSDEALPTAGL